MSQPLNSMINQPFQKSSSIKSSIIHGKSFCSENHTSVILPVCKSCEYENLHRLFKGLKEREKLLLNNERL